MEIAMVGIALNYAIATGAILACILGAILVFFGDKM